MDVRGSGAFYHFAKNNGLNGIHPEVNALIVCMEEYDRLCACDSPEFRDSKLNQCRAIYENFISKADGFKSTFLSKTSDGRVSFYSDHGRLIKSFSR